MYWEIRHAAFARSQKACEKRSRLENCFGTRMRARKRGSAPPTEGSRSFQLKKAKVRRAAGLIRRRGMHFVMRSNCEKERSNQISSIWAFLGLACVTLACVSSDESSTPASPPPRQRPGNPWPRRSRPGTLGPQSRLLRRPPPFARREGRPPTRRRSR